MDNNAKNCDDVIDRSDSDSSASGREDESDEEYEDSLDYVLNPHAPVFIPRPVLQPTEVNDMVYIAENPQEEVLETDQSSQLEESSLGDLHQGDVAAEEEEEVEVDVPHRAEVSLHEEVEQHALGGHEVSVNDSGSLNADSVVDSPGVSPAVCNRPKRERHQPDRYQTGVMHQQTPSPMKNTKLDTVKTVMEMQHKMLFDVLQYLNPKEG